MFAIKILNLNIKWKKNNGKSTNEMKWLNTSVYFRVYFIFHLEHAESGKPDVTQKGKIIILFQVWKRLDGEVDKGHYHTGDPGPDWDWNLGKHPNGAG
jgi:hypothetical protein